MVTSPWHKGEFAPNLWGSPLICAHLCGGRFCYGFPSSSKRDRPSYYKIELKESIYRDSGGGCLASQPAKRLYDMVRQRQIEKSSHPFPSIPSGFFAIAHLLSINKFLDIRALKAYKKSTKGKIRQPAHSASEEILLVSRSTPKAIHFLLSLPNLLLSWPIRKGIMAHTNPFLFFFIFFFFSAAHNTSSLCQFHTLRLGKAEQEHGGSTPHQANRTQLS